MDETLADFDAWADQHRHCEFFWYPGKDVCELKRIDETDAAPDPLPERPHERIDHSDRVLQEMLDESLDRTERQRVVAPEHAAEQNDGTPELSLGHS